MNLDALNEKMIAENLYNDRDLRDMQKISMLKDKNDYDYYLIVCALCNYDIPEKKELFNLRMEYFSKVNGSGIDYSHKAEDYDIKHDELKIQCKNTGNINKYGFYEYEINSTSKDLINTLWGYKNEDCLKYVDSKTYPDKIIISIKKDQFDNFIAVLDKLTIGYDKNDLGSNMFYNNTSNNKLIDLATLSLPFDLYPYQIEDANRLITMKRALLGQEMGCVSGNSNICIKENGKKVNRNICIANLYKLIQTNKTIKIKCLVNGKFAFMPIKDVLQKGIQKTIKLTTANTSIECTGDHLIYTKNGWKSAMDLVVGDEICTTNTKDNNIYNCISNIDVTTTDISNIEFISNNNCMPKLETITNIEQGETQEVYDIVIDSLDIHNFACNDIIVHNCGKTVISILIGESIDTPKLVICPESLRLNWQREILTVRPDADVQILLSNEVPHFGKDWTIIGYLTASKFIEDLKRFDCIFVDEAQYCKAVNNWGKPSSKRAEAVINLANNATYCYLLSGTPMPSHNKDLYNILKMLKCPEFDFNNKWAFKNYGDKYCNPQQTYFGVDYSGNSNSEQLHEILKPLMVRRLKKDVLPHLTKQRQFIPIAPVFKRDYKAIMQRLKSPNKDDTYMGLAMTGRQLLSQYKVGSAIDLAESMLDAEESVVIVTNFIESANKLKEHFKENACEIRGGMSDDDKQLAIDDFQEGKKKVCILNMMAGGVGITLTASHNMIIMDYAWLPADMIQVEDRICRTGQTECCNIYYIYCDNSILDKIFINMITDKSANIDLVVDNAENTFDLADTKSKATTYLETLKKEIKKL